MGRVPEPSTQAKALVSEEPATWQGTEVLRWYEPEGCIGERSERWIVAQSAQGVERQHATHPSASGAGPPALDEASARPRAAPLCLCGGRANGLPPGPEGSASLAGNRSPRAGQYPAYQTGPPTHRHGAGAGLERAGKRERPGSRAGCRSRAQSQIHGGDQRACLAQERCSSGCGSTTGTTALNAGVLFPGSPVPGLVSVCQEGRTGDGDGVRDGPCLLVYRLADHRLR